ncbi:MAG TPA: DNA ligase D [Planctomycetota bacterium]|nr:DNA ligase D [Planctomycetota bacterium]
MKHHAPLDLYQSKRDFSRTPEPRGEAGAEGQELSFYVQRHQARQLHYDFRLEWDGVLKSWAIPKGISSDPRVKRLAIHVEDHPLSYGTFEGTIPEGEYGAGKVTLWDQGTWTPEGDVHEAYRRGTIAFTLHGKKLSGRWSLIRFKTFPDRPAKDTWLLRKLSGRIPGRDPEGERAAGHSRTGSPKQRRSRRSPAPLPGARRSGVPTRIDPELATLVSEAPGGDDWIHEVKWDGYRFLSTVQAGVVRMRTRNGRDWAARFPDLHRELASLPVRSAVLDGEVVALSPRGVSSFDLLKESLTTGERSHVFYYLFDLLYLDGIDLRGRALEERKQALSRLLGAAPDAPHLRYSEHVQGRGDLFYRHACELQMEGIVSKRKDAPYRPGRGRDWVKVKCQQRQEFVIGGFTAPRGSRKVLGALLLGTVEEGTLVYAGRVGAGFSTKDLDQLGARLTTLERPTSPFATRLSPRELRAVHWVEPRLVAEIAFANWTTGRRLRQPVFLGLREDKEPGEVGREEPQPAPRMDVPLTHPDRVLYPGEGITKRDLARYYEALAPWILPHVRGRLLSIVRCPDGVAKTCFYQKHPSASMPPGIQSIPFDEKEKPATGISIDDGTGLLGLVQIGAVELHPWASRIRDLEHPDRGVFDLDPGPGVPWKDVVRAARQVGAALEGEGLESFVKTTGGKGLHVVVPFSDRPDWPTLRAFVRRVAEDLVRRHPDRFTGLLSKAARPGKILIDTLRNERGATAVAPYSARAHPQATVSTPLLWKELSPALRPEAFTVKSLPLRIARLSIDPWVRMTELRQSVPKPS